MADGTGVYQRMLWLGCTVSQTEKKCSDQRIVGIELWYGVKAILKKKNRYVVLRTHCLIQ